MHCISCPVRTMSLHEPAQTSSNEHAMLANGADIKPKIEARRKGAKRGVFQVVNHENRGFFPHRHSIWKDALIDARCRSLY